jgi:hypothetical protein
MNAEIFQLACDLAAVTRAVEGMTDDGTFTTQEQLRAVEFMEKVVPQLSSQKITHHEAFERLTAKYGV